MSYSLKFFCAAIQDAVEAATKEVAEARGEAVELSDLLRALAEAEAFDGPLGVSGADRALLSAHAARAKSLFSKLRRPTQPQLSTKLRSTLDDARFHARSRSANNVEVPHLTLAIIRTDAAAALGPLGVTSERLIEMVAEPEPEPPAPPLPRKTLMTDGLSVSALWDLIHTEIERIGESPDEWLGAPAADDELDALETRLGVELPPDVRASYLVHNGSLDRLHDVYELLDLTLIESEYGLVKDSEDAGDHAGYDDSVDHDDGVQPRFWCPAWVPLLQMSGKTEYLCMDLEPAEQGRRGQLITWAMDDFDRHIEHPSFRDYLAWFAVELRNADTRGEFALVET